MFGVAYGQRQADVLAEEGVTARNIRRWLDGQARLDAGRGSRRRRDVPAAPGGPAGRRRGRRRTHPGPGRDPPPLRRQAGAKLLLVGDTRQLAAVGAGGALADIAERGITYDLAEVRRFTEAWEGPASLRLRDGDTTVVDEYAKHGRLVDAGTVEQAEQQAARVWLADTLAGRDALLIVGTNAAAARVSTQLRAELVRLGRVAEAGVPLGMPGWEGTVAGVGDLVQARRNAWHLDGWAGNTEAPINRQTYRVTATRPDGGLTVARVTGRDDGGTEQLADPIELPGRYVRDRVTLAYANTVHAAHGRSVDAGYGVLGPGTDAAAALRAGHPRPRQRTCCSSSPATSADTAEIGETQKVARRTAARGARRRHPPARGRARTAPR